MEWSQWQAMREVRAQVMESGVSGEHMRPLLLKFICNSRKIIIIFVGKIKNK